MKARPTVSGVALQPVSWFLAALLPVASGLAWRLLLPPAPSASAACGDPLGAPFLWRLGQAAVPLATLALAARLLGASPGSLSLRPPQGASFWAAFALAAAIVPAAAFLGPIAAVPFFGPLHLGGGFLAALPAALALAAANAVAEELSFRGALLGWGSRLLGFRGALLLQAALFGLLHLSSDFRADPWPVLLVVTAAGLAAGLLVRRTGSLYPVLILHAAFDVPLFWIQLCRLP